MLEPAAPSLAATLLRIKRKATQLVEDSIVVEETAAPPDVGAALGGMRLGDDAQPHPKRCRRYVRLSTYNAHSLSQLSVEDVKRLVERKRDRSGASDSPASAPPGSQEASSEAEPPESSQRPPPGCSYEQIGRRDGYTMFERSEHMRDGLKEWSGALVDVLRREPGVIRLPTEPASSLSSAEDGYLYDVYVAVEAEGATEGLGGESLALGEEALEWEEAHRRGLTPVLRICMGDVELVDEAADESDSDVCSSDSNAEGHFGNDYGDEDSYGSGEEDDREAGWRGRGKSGARGWYDDDEEYSGDGGSY